MQKQRGFSLVELSIVMIIIGLIMTGGMSVLSAQVTATRQAETKSNMEVIRIALLSYISRNGRLPCPAVTAIAQGNAAYGVEATTQGTCDGLPAFGAVAPFVVVTGIVPWVSLGISDNVASDGHFNRFTYQVVRDATAIASDNHKVAGLRGFGTLHSDAPPTPANQINNCSGGLAYNPCAAVVVLISHGRNGFGAFSTGGVQMPVAGAGAAELANLDNDNAFVKKDYSDVAGNPFDDSVSSLSAADLLTQLTLNGSVKDARSEVILTLDSVKGSVMSYALSHAFAIPLASPTTPQDVWGTPIVYSRSVNTITPATPPGIAFTLSSNGPDAQPGTADDITIPVSVGELQGVFAKSSSFSGP